MSEPAITLERAPPAAVVPSPRLAIAALLTALMLVVLDASIVNIALPTLSRALGVSAAASMSIVTAYQVALVMTLLPCAALGEQLGHRRVFVGGVALFVAASAGCAAAPNLAWLVTARFVQGVGAAAVMSLSVALLRAVVPAKRFGAAIGWNALVVALTTASGPTIGALLLSVAPWPWLFAINVPLGVFALVAAGALPDLAGAARRLDGAAIGLNMVGLGALVVGAELLPKAPFLAVAGLAAGGLSLAALIRREASKAAPLFPLDLLRRPAFRLSAAASVCCFTGQGAALVALPFYLQRTLGLSPLEAGFYITPWPLMAAVAALLAGRLARPTTMAWVCAAGCALLSTGLLIAATWPIASSPAVVMPIVMLCGLGFGLFQVTNNRNMFLSAPPDRSGAAGGLQSVSRLTGQTAGVVIMTLLFSLEPAAVAPRLGLAIGATLALSAGLISARRTGASEAGYRVAQPRPTSASGTQP